MSRKGLTIISATILFLVLNLGRGEGLPGIVVVVNSQNSLSGITTKELRDIYYGKKTAWTDGTEIEVVDLQAERKERQEFSQIVFNIDPAAVEKNYMKLVFTGQGRPPQQVMPTPQKVLSFIAYNRSAIGYVDEADITDPAIREKIKTVSIKN